MIVGKFNGMQRGSHMLWQNVKIRVLIGWSFFAYCIAGYKR